MAEISWNNRGSDFSWKKEAAGTAEPLALQGDLGKELAGMSARASLKDSAEDLGEQG